MPSEVYPNRVIAGTSARHERLVLNGEHEEEYKESWNGVALAYTCFAQAFGVDIAIGKLSIQAKNVQ